MDGVGKLQCIGNNPRERMLIKCTGAQLEKTRNETKNRYNMLLKKLCAEHFQLSQEETDRMLETFSEEELDELRELLKKKSAKFRRNLLVISILPVLSFFSLGFLPVIGSVFLWLAVITASIEIIGTATHLSSEGFYVSSRYEFYSLCKRYEMYFPKRVTKS